MRLFPALALSVCFAATAAPAALIAQAAAAAAPSAAASPAHTAKAKQLLDATNTSSGIQQQLAGLRDRVKELASQQFAGTQFNPAQTALQNEYLKKVQDILADETDWAKLSPRVTQVYADSFTDAEIDSIVAFYKTPAGQALLAKTPATEQKVNAIISANIKEMQPRLQELTESYVNKIKAAGTPAPGAGTAPSLAPKPAAPAPKN